MAQPITQKALDAFRLSVKELMEQSVNKLLAEGKLPDYTHNPYIADDADRIFCEFHCRALAEYMHTKRLYRNSWRVEVGGCVYKFKIEGYAKRGSEEEILMRGVPEE